MLKIQKINVFCVLLVNPKIDLFTVVLLGYLGPTPKLLPIVFCAILYAKLAYLFLYFFGGEGSDAEEFSNGPDI
jgi:hypothetical protein